MRFSLLSCFICGSLLGGWQPAFAQRAAPTPPAAARPAAGRLALAPAAATTAAAPAAVAARLACSRLNGQVLGLGGKPLVGATVTVKGTQHLYITNSDGRYLVAGTVYQGQTLEIEAAGYTARDIILTDCTAPVVGLELAPGTRVKKNGKRAGQITRFGTADMQ
ncbi:carboxypeptidase-like regulatory domain-containing protein [uncultured Hymenobacter sp.]|uniref:carboxypeptidase-like regulatory domain-containing protein n=1 Tax=uncultured Hymenobacter sp. TaxID=170016 RepID=UPI0035CCA398